MTQTMVSRRRPCRRCGGRYFVGTVSLWGALVAVLVAVGGIAKTVAGSGALKAMGDGAIPDLDGFLANAAWAVGGIVIAGIVLIAGHGYRCVNCDGQQ